MQEQVVTGSVLAAVLVGGLGIAGSGYLASDPAVATVAASHRYAAAPTTTSLVSPRNPSPDGRFVTPIATVSSFVGIPWGTVDFLDGARTVCDDVRLDRAGVAACAVHLSADVHPLTAIFTGNTDFGPSASLPLAQVVRRP